MLGSKILSSYDITFNSEITYNTNYQTNDTMGNHDSQPDLVEE